MPDVATAFPELENLQAAELENIRRSIVSDLQIKYRGYDDPEVPIELLHKLAFVTSRLRRKSAGPPKATKAPAKGRGKATLDDLML